MSSVDEREAIRLKSDAIVVAAAHGNKAALRYMQEFGLVCRVLDDLYDADYPVEQQHMLMVFRWLSVGCFRNSFFCEHRDILVAYQATVLSAWEESNQLEAGSEVQKIYAHVLRDWCLSIVPAIANIIGGYEHMRAIEKKVWALYMKPLGG